MKLTRNNAHYQISISKEHRKAYLKIIFAMVILPFFMASLIGMYVPVQDTNAQELVSSNRTDSEPKDNQGPEDNKSKEVRGQEEGQSTQQAMNCLQHQTMTAPSLKSQIEIHASLSGHHPTEIASLILH